MSNTRLTVPLNLAEKSALYKMASDDKREAKYQAAYLIRYALIKSGYLTTPMEVTNGDE